MTSGDDRPSTPFAYHLAQRTWPPAKAYIARLEFDATDAAGAATRRALEAHLAERVQDDELELLKTLACEHSRTLILQRAVSPRARRPRLDPVVALAARGWLALLRARRYRCR